MADNDVVVAEVEAGPIETDSQPIADLIKAIEDENFTGAEQSFNDILADKLDHTLDQARARIAGQMMDNEPEAEKED